MSSEVSCSDCKIERIEKRWTRLLLKWVNTCIYENGEVTKLNATCISDIMNKYKDDVCVDNIDQVMIFTDDMDTYIHYKYPILRLSIRKQFNVIALGIEQGRYWLLDNGKLKLGPIRYLTEDSDIPKKLFFMATILLYHCCVNSHTGLVDGDICKYFSKFEQELILKFCEKLSKMETTMNNIEMSIRGAFESVSKLTELSGSINDLDASTSSFAQISNTSTIKSSLSALPFDPAPDPQRKTEPATKFTYSVTVLPSGKADSNSDEKSSLDTEESPEKIEVRNLINIKPKPTISQMPNKNQDSKDLEKNSVQAKLKELPNKTYRHDMIKKDFRAISNQDRLLLTGLEILPKITVKNEKQGLDDTVDPGCKECSCTKCKTGKSCSEPGGDRKKCDNVPKPPIEPKSSNIAPRSMVISIAVLALVVIILVIFIVGALFNFFLKPNKTDDVKLSASQLDRPISVHRLASVRTYYQDEWKCENSLCEKVYEPSFQETYPSYSTCLLKCSGPQIWPLPAGSTHYSKEIILLSIYNLEYKLKTVNSDNLRQYLAEAFKLFIGDLAKLEETGLKYRNNTKYKEVKKATIIVHVLKDPDPRLTLNTVEDYKLNLKTNNDRVTIEIESISFCGVRHGLETLSQMILLDHHTGYLTTISNAAIIDGPSYQYRGLMIDTGRNYIPVADLMRTVDGMATVKLNTFHWRISDVTSFPLLLSKLPEFVEYGSYYRSMVYTKDDVKTIVKRAGVRGIRVLIEIAPPGPVGRPWSWTRGVTCTNQNNSCDNVLCLKSKPLDNVLNIFEILYAEILEMTQVNDVFHLSHGDFSFVNCLDHTSNRYEFLLTVLERLKKVNNRGSLPTLPIIWHTSHLRKFETKKLMNFGVQLTDWKNTYTEQLSNFKLIHSGSWDLGCEMKNHTCKRYRSWQEMYAWKQWRKMETNSDVGGEALLWTDLVNADNLDYHIWPRLAAVAERLWSDLAINKTADGPVYVRLNVFRSRLQRDLVSVQHIWPAWCDYNPGSCLMKIQ